ncbi:collagenase-like [Uranotaenia lowii]|uniref:collagenase-like n=1 Tax=Uranotaenia lowii TaxID=190385 RepID=UPI0024790114|nr:collagenase-like [Uranotaenia lowii]
MFWFWILVATFLVPPNPTGAQQGRIINGEDAEYGQFPYQVMLIIQMAEGRALCGGSLLSEEWVLTAGHCVDNATSFQVTMGNLYLKPDGGHEEGAIVMNTTEYYQHENYSSSTAQNDIAVIRLPEKVEYSYRIGPVKLPSGHDDYNQRETIVSGWGKETDFGGAAQRLQYTNLTVISNTRCSMLYGPGIIQPTILCCQGEQRKSTCNGDSGGPLVLADDRTLVGIVSFGHIIGCERRLPMGFTRVTEFTDWITTITGVKSSSSGEGEAGEKPGEEPSPKRPWQSLFG